MSKSFVVGAECSGGRGKVGCDRFGSFGGYGHQLRCGGGLTGGLLKFPLCRVCESSQHGSYVQETGGQDGLDTLDCFNKCRVVGGGRCDGRYV